MASNAGYKPFEPGTLILPNISRSSGKDSTHILESKKKNPLIVFCMYCVMVIWSTGFYIMQTNAEVSLRTYSDALRYPITLASIPVSVYMLFKFLRNKNVFLVTKLSIPLLLLYFFSASTILYAPIPRQTFDVFIAMLELTIFMGAFATLAETPRQCLENFYSLLFLIITLCYFAVVVRPDAGIHVNDAYNYDVDQVIGAWRGIFWHKNTAGIFASMLLILTLTFRPSGLLGMRIVRIGTFFSAAYFLFMSENKSSFVIVFVLSLLNSFPNSVWKRVSHYRWLLSILFTLVLSTFFLFGLYVLEPDYGITFTNRTPIWQLHQSYWMLSPWLGHGYAGVVIENGGIAAFGRGWEATMKHAHNGYLDVLGQLGIIGLALLFIAIITAVSSGLALSADKRAANWARPATLLLLTCLLAGLMEANIMTDRFIWCFAVVLMFFLNGVRASNIQADRSVIALHQDLAAATLARTSRTPSNGASADPADTKVR